MMVHLSSKVDERISADQIEIVNAYGPFNQAVWTAKGVRIGNEERLRERREFLVKRETKNGPSIMPFA